MRLVPFDNPLTRLFKGGAGTRFEFQVIARGRPETPFTPEQLEDATERALDHLTESAGDIALGAVAGCNYERSEIELAFTVEAASAADLHRRIGHVLRVLEEGGDFQLHDTTTSRLDEDRETVLA